MSQHSNQEQNKKQFQLNPSAVEFVPSFASGSLSTNTGASNSYQSYKQHNYNSNNQRYHNNQYTHNNYNQNSNHHFNNRTNHNYRNNNQNNYHHGHNYHHQQPQNHYQSSNYYFNNINNSNDVDPIELEARCEAVIEILQDDQIRDQLNPVSRFQNETNNINNHFDSNQENPELDDEEDLEEMLAMQEECRLEMMKFYIQSQNPNLFEEIYHDVSYPEGVKKEETTTKGDSNASQNQTEDPVVQSESKQKDLVEDHMSNLKINDEKH